MDSSRFFACVFENVVDGFVADIRRARALYKKLCINTRTVPCLAL